MGKMKNVVLIFSTRVISNIKEDLHLNHNLLSLDVISFLERNLIGTGKVLHAGEVASFNPFANRGILCGVAKNTSSNSNEF